MREKMFSLVPVIAKIIKVVAVLFLLFFLIQSIQGFVSTIGAWKGGIGPYGQPIPPIRGFGSRLASLAGPFSTLLLGLLISTLAWEFAELFNMVRRLVIGRPEEPVITREK